MYRISTPIIPRNPPIRVSSPSHWWSGGSTILGCEQDETYLQMPRQRIANYLGCGDASIYQPSDASVSRKSPQSGAVRQTIRARDGRTHRFRLISHDRIASLESRCADHAMRWLCFFLADLVNGRLDRKHVEHAASISISAVMRSSSTTCIPRLPFRCRHAIARWVGWICSYHRCRDWCPLPPSVPRSAVAQSLERGTIRSLLITTRTKLPPLPAQREATPTTLHHRHWLPQRGDLQAGAGLAAA